MSTQGVFDFQQQFNDMVASGMDAIKAIFPVRGPRRTMQLDRLWLEDNKRSDDYAGQKSVKLRGSTWEVPIIASLTLLDNASGKVIDKIDRMKLMGIPKNTPRYGFVVEGNEYQIKNQLRLKSGAYSTIAADGSFVTQVMTAKGHNYIVEMEPQTSVFTITPSSSSSRIKLYPVLRSLGVSDQAISQAWGPKVAQANTTAARTVMETEVQKFHKALFGTAGQTPTHSIDRIRQYFEKATAISPETTVTTLGQSFEKVQPELFLAAGKRLLAIARQEEPPDDKNSLVNKELHSVDTFIRERVQQAVPRLKARILAAMEKRDDIRQVVSPEQFTQAIRSFFTKNSLASPTKQTNPVEILGDQFKVTLMGPGGIKSERAVPDDLRHLHGSQAGFIDPLQTPESENVGTTLSIALGAAKKGNQLVQPLINLKTGQVEEKNPAETWPLTVAFPGQFQKKGNRWEPVGPIVSVLRNHKESRVPANEATHMLVNEKAMFSVAANLVPFLNADSMPRAAMASKHQEQAVSLVNREQPLVQVQAIPGQTFEKIVGRESAILSRLDGTVVKITPDEIVVQDGTGSKHPHGIYNHFPLNQKTFYHSEPRVKEGDKVHKDQVLADSNYTREGVSALGTNVRVGYLPAKGYNFEDGIYISESAAKQFTSEHMYRYQVDIAPTTILSRDKFLAKFPGIYKTTQVAKLDAGGVVRVGQRISRGDPIALRLQREEVMPEDKILAKLRRGQIDPYRNRAVEWEENFEGEVTDVVQMGKYVLVVAKTRETAQIGDKLSTRHAAKGVITRIIPDAEMPHTQDGQHLQVLLNPNGIPSRMNTGQLAELLAGKIVRKTGQTIVHNNFDPNITDIQAHIEALAKRHGLQDKEYVTDPKTGQKMDMPISVGELHMMKLNHPTRAKFSKRGIGEGYLEDLTPSQGDAQGGQSIDALTMYDMLAHGAKHNLREMSWLKSQANPEFWRAFQTGQYLPPPKPSFTFRKLTDLMKGAGINVEKRGDSLLLMPLLDRHIKEFSHGEIKEPLVVRAKDLEPEKNGLFDRKITGGLKGENWSHVKLTEPTPHPTFEVPIKSITGLKQEQFDSLVAGKSYLDPHTNAIGHHPTGLTGGAAIKHLLSQVDVAKEITAIKGKIGHLTGPALDQMNRRLRYLMACQTTGIHPREYVVDMVPVVPPILRPSYPDEQGNLRHSDLNMLTRDIIMVNNDLKSIHNLPDKEKQDLRRDVYDGFKALVGLGNRTLSPDKDYKGIMEYIAGDAPKHGFFQSKLVKRRQDLSGRSTAVTEPNMGVDEVGIPEEMAWDIFRPHIIRELTQTRSKTFLQAQDLVDGKAPEARNAMQVVADRTPVMMNRAPSLHKFSIMSFMPKIVQGQAVKTHPLIVKGFNLDHDGDTVAIHVPVLPKAIEEARKMLPSRNLFNPSTNQLMTMPDQEAVQGLYFLSKDAMGQAKINAILPTEYHTHHRWTASHLADLLERIAREKPTEFPKIVNDLKDIGNHAAYHTGVTIGLSDLKLNRTGRDTIVRHVEEQELKIHRQGMPEKQKMDALLKLYQSGDDAFQKFQPGALEKSDSMLYHGLKSGMKGKASQVKQMVVGAGLYNAPDGSPVPIFVKRSLSEGLPFDQYWAGLYGARKGIIDRSIETAEPGALSKEMVRTAHNYIITIPSCHTQRGDVIPTTDELRCKNAVGHYLARDVPGVAVRDQLVTGELLRAIRGKASSLMVRSPLYCEANHGVCQKCYGTTEYSTPPSIGDNIGAIAAHSIGEPATQLTMRTFHTGGVASAVGGLTGAFDRLNEVIEVPKNLPGSATLSKHTGAVTRIEANPAGGHKVWVDDHEHFVAPGRDLLVSKGHLVNKAQPLSGGKVNPHDLLQLKGMQVTRDFLSAELHRIYNESGIPLRKVHSDVIAKAMTDITHIRDPGDHPDHVHGDHASLSAIDAWNKSGHGKPVVHAPILTPMSMVPLKTTDWLDRLNSRDLKKTMQEGAARLWSTSVKGIKPIPAYVYGAHFGDEEQGYY